MAARFYVGLGIVGRVQSYASKPTLDVRTSLRTQYRSGAMACTTEYWYRWASAWYARTEAEW